MYLKGKSKGKRYRSKSSQIKTMRELLCILPYVYVLVSTKVVYALHALLVSTKVVLCMQYASFTSVVCLDSSRDERGLKT